MSLCERARLLMPKEIRPYIYLLRSIWAEIILSGDLKQAEIEKLVEHPFRFAHPLAEAICALLLQKLGRKVPPLRAEIAPLPMGEMCELSILRLLIQGDVDLAKKLLPFCSFPTLWTPEGEYNPQETKLSIELLRSVFGKASASTPIHDPYFSALKKMVLSLEKRDDFSSSQDFELARLDLFSDSIESAFATVGEGIPLGAMKAKGIEIPAFGPQEHPLNDPKLFGIDRKIPDARWASLAARPECWFEVNPLLDRQGIETRFFGLTPETPISFVFYIKASSAKIDSDLYLPKSLRRYSKESKKIVFEHMGSSISIENICPSKMDLIPLAGSGCFWESDFLLSYEIPVHDGRAIFQIRSK